MMVRYVVCVMVRWVVCDGEVEVCDGEVVVCVMVRL